MHITDRNLRKKQTGWAKLGDEFYPILVLQKITFKTKSFRFLYLNENGSIGGGGTMKYADFYHELPPGRTPKIPMPGFFPVTVPKGSSYGGIKLELTKNDDGGSGNQVTLTRADNKIVVDRHYLSELIDMLTLAQQEIEREREEKYQREKEQAEYEKRIAVKREEEGW